MAGPRRLMALAGLVLSGGKSSRMGGGEKALLALDGRPLMAWALATLTPQVAGVAINANTSRDDYAAFGLPVIGDTLPGHLGPLAGVLAGMRWAGAEGFDRLLTVAGDTPFFPTDLATCLDQGLAEAEGAEIAMAATPDPARGVSRHPTFAIWPVDRADALEAALHDGLRKIVAWTDEIGCAEVMFDTTPYDPFFNVNTPDDMSRAERMVAEFGL